MNPEITIKISTTTPKGVEISELPPAPMPSEGPPSAIDDEMPSPSENIMGTITDDEDLPTPLPLDQLELAAAEAGYAPIPTEQIAIDEVPEPSSLTTLSSMAGEPSIEEDLPEPEELDTLATK